MIGLVGGSQAKFWYRHLPDAHIEVAENNPYVLALRRTFRIPDDDVRFRVVLDDGAHFLRERRGKFDLLLVDGYDETGIPEELSSPRFYDDCRAALIEGGVMAINLYCDDAQRHIDRLRRSFGRRHVVVLEEARQINRVALAWAGMPAEGALMALSAVAQRDLAPVFASVVRGKRSRRQADSAFSRLAALVPECELGWGARYAVGQQPEANPPLSPFFKWGYAAARGVHRIRR